MRSKSRASFLAGVLAERTSICVEDADTLDPHTSAPGELSTNGTAAAVREMAAEADTQGAPHVSFVRGEALHTGNTHRPLQSSGPDMAASGVKVHGSGHSLMRSMSFRDSVRPIRESGSAGTGSGQALEVGMSGQVNAARFSLGGSFRDMPALGGSAREGSVGGDNVMLAQVATLLSRMEEWMTEQITMKVLMCRYSRVDTALALCLSAANRCVQRFVPDLLGHVVARRKLCRQQPHTHNIII